MSNDPCLYVCMHNRWSLGFICLGLLYVHITIASRTTVLLILLINHLLLVTYYLYLLYSRLLLYVSSYVPCFLVCATFVQHSLLYIFFITKEFSLLGVKMLTLLDHSKCYDLTIITFALLFHFLKLVTDLNKCVSFGTDSVLLILLNSFPSCHH